MKSLCVRETVLLLLGCFASGEISYADEPNSPFPYSNPSSRTGEPTTEGDPPAVRFSPTATRLSDNSPSEAEGTGFKWPTLPRPKLPSLPKPTLPKLALPSWTTEKAMPRERLRPADEPSTWQKFSSGTKDMFTKTKQTLMPWSQEETVSSARKTTQPPRRTPPKTAARTKAKSASSEKKSLFPWFNKKPEEKPVETVNEFLAQPRIK